MSENIIMAMWIIGQIFAVVIGILLYLDDFGYAKSILVVYTLFVLLDIRKELTSPTQL